MKKIIIFNLLIGLFTIQLFAQEISLSNSFELLSVQFTEKSTYKEIDKIISKAEKLFKQEKEKADNNKEKLAKVFINYALFNKEAYEVLNQKKRSSQTDRKTLIKIIPEINKIGLKIEEIFEDGIEMYEEKLNLKNSQLADAKYEFAQFIYNFTPTQKGPEGQKQRIERLRKVQDLLLESLKIQEQVRDHTDDKFLISNYYLATSYSETADFAKALPHYEKYINGIEEKYGKKTKVLVPALRTYGAILAMLEEDDEVETISKQISAIVGEKENLADTLLYLSPRAKSDEYKGIKNKGGKVLLTTTTYVSRERVDLPIFQQGNSSAGNIKFNNSNAVQDISLTFSEFPDVIMVLITVSEEGKVVEIIPQTDDDKLIKKIKSNVSKWEFEPLIYKGVARKIKGIVYYFD